MKLFFLFSKKKHMTKSTQLTSHPMANYPLKVLSQLEKTHQFDKLPNLKIFPSATKTSKTDNKVTHHFSSQSSNSSVLASYCLHIRYIRSYDKTSGFMSTSGCTDHCGKYFTKFEMGGYC